MTEHIEPPEDSDTLKGETESDKRRTALEPLLIRQRMGNTPPETGEARPKKPSSVAQP